MPSIGWQFIPYLLITVAEIMVSITGLEFAYTQAPRAMKSTIMSFWLLSVTFGNLWVLMTNAAVRNDAVTAQIASMIQEKAFDDLDAPVLRVCSLDSPAIYSPPLEAIQLPTPEVVVAKALTIC